MLLYLKALSSVGITPSKLATRRFIVAGGNNQDDRIAKMTLASVYPHYVRKVESKGRTKAELHQVIHWLTGYDEQTLDQLIQGSAGTSK